MSCAPLLCGYGTNLLPLAIMYEAGSSLGAATSVEEEVDEGEEEEEGAEPREPNGLFGSCQG